MKRPTKKTKRKPNPYRVANEDKLQIFVSEYIKTHNGTRAAIVAGYSKHTAHVTGSQLLRNPKVVALLDADRAKYTRKTDITVEFLLNELKLIAKARLGDYAYRDENGKLHLRAAAIDDSEMSAAINEINTHTGKIKLHDKLAAIDKLGLHLGLWGKDRKLMDEGEAKEITIKGGLPDVPYEDKK